VLVLSELEGYSNPEIAAMLEISIDTVKIRLHRARARLKLELSRGCVFSHDKNNNLECQRSEPSADHKQRQ
jgi:RNA polymerase sigma-70 factor (ECF subfamily)